MERQFSLIMFSLEMILALSRRRITFFGESEGLLYGKFRNL